MLDTNKIVAEIVDGRHDTSKIIKALQGALAEGVASTRWRLDTTRFGEAFADVGVIDEGALTLGELEMIEREVGPGFWWGDAATFRPTNGPRCARAVLTAALMERAGMAHSEAVKTARSITDPDAIADALEFYEVKPADPT